MLRKTIEAGSLLLLLVSFFLTQHIFSSSTPSSCVGYPGGGGKNSDDSKTGPRITCTTINYCSNGFCTITVSWTAKGNGNYILVWFPNRQGNGGYGAISVAATSITLTDFKANTQFGMKVTDSASRKYGYPYYYFTTPKSTITSSNCNNQCKNGQICQSGKCVTVTSGKICGGQAFTPSYTNVSSDPYKPSNFDPTSMCQSESNCDEINGISGTTLNDWGPFVNNPADKNQHNQVAPNAYCQKNYSKTKDIYCCINQNPQPTDPCSGLGSNAEQGYYCGSNLEYGVRGAYHSGNPDTLYYCIPANAYSPSHTVGTIYCGKGVGCTVQGAGIDDTCNTPKPTQPAPSGGSGGGGGGGGRKLLGVHTMRLTLNAVMTYLFQLFTHH